MPQAQRCQYANDVVILEEGAAIQDALVEKSDNERTVPNIFIMGVHQEGGNDKIQKMGPKLDQLLQKVAEAEVSAAQESNSPVSESA
jgi:glutaredoxin